jgi:trehalose-6-phosphate synthase
MKYRETYNRRVVLI